jgi:hypothetical protein
MPTTSLERYTPDASNACLYICRISRVTGSGEIFHRDQHTILHQSWSIASLLILRLQSTYQFRKSRCILNKISLCYSRSMHHHIEHLPEVLTIQFLSSSLVASHYPVKVDKIHSRSVFGTPNRFERRRNGVSGGTKASLGKPNRVGTEESVQRPASRARHP